MKIKDCKPPSLPDALSLWEKATFTKAGDLVGATGRFARGIQLPDVRAADEMKKGKEQENDSAR